MLFSETIIKEGGDPEPMKKEKQTGKEKKGFPLSRFNFILEIVVLVVSALLLITTFRVNGGYQRLKDISDQYIECERQATQLEIVTPGTSIFPTSPPSPELPLSDIVPEAKQ